ncbi:axonemal dynein gamma heavy chain [Reticulomyxa filosa]|uniref:Axonemal dynein gamma heavy chain n=1 Tax=Reticulomyxa filosa TaxID=46433 RepID=X6NRG1_RETFI|nr:axonemal dynein gamma heavy chain [Reticulomyxa filosa]|eukprot:ETO28518.1 axonemal dynein gamma heavy chain [Reticulomyxa filosa]
MVDMSLVNWMYQSSLAQYLKWFDKSLKDSQPANLVHQRVQNIIDFMTYHIYDNVSRGLFGRDQLTFKLMCALRISSTANLLANEEIQTFLKCGSALATDKLPKKPFDWLQPNAWANCVALSQSLDFFRDLLMCIGGNEKKQTTFFFFFLNLLLLHANVDTKAWRLWYESETPESLDIPVLQERLQQIKMRSFMKMVLVRALRDDRMTLSSQGFVAEVMGEKYIQPLTVTMEEVWKTSDKLTPTILMLTPGADPTQTLKDLARKMGAGVEIVSMGEGQEPHATKAITSSMGKGDWALLQNCHLGLKYMASLPDQLKKWNEETKVEDGFRLWITCEPHEQFPISLLQISVKVTQEAPQGMKAGLLRSYRTLVNKDRLQRVDKKEWRDLVFALCFLHSTVQERRKFGSLGWNIPYEFNESDLDASLMFLEKHMFNSPQDISWPTVQYMICEAQYGGRITDNFDRILFNTYGTAWLGSQCFDSNFTFQSTKGGFNYTIPRVATVEEYTNYIQQFPANDSPEIFGLHANAELTCGSTLAAIILNTILDTQPKESSGSSGKTREEIVKANCQELLERMPADYVEEDVRDKIKKRPKAELDFIFGKKDTRGVNGFEVPLNVFLYQEIVRLQATISNVRNTLKSLILAIDGVVIMTPNLQLALNSIYDAKPPRYWFQDASGATIAWTLPSLALWFQGLLDREKQLTDWLVHGRPNVHWMTGFFNPQGFLTAMKQEVTRKHKNDRWALDDVILKTAILDEVDYRKFRSPPDDGGVYIRGLFLDGCSWDFKDKLLCESKPKELFTTLPIIHCTATTNKMVCFCFSLLLVFLIPKLHCLA